MLARAASCGKNPDMVYYALDSTGAATDPAVTIHALAIGAWARAWWEERVPHDALEAAHIGAMVRLAEAPSSPRSIVSGPVAALVATTRRIGRSFVPRACCVTTLAARGTCCRRLLRL